MNINKIISALFLFAAPVFADVNDGDTYDVGGVTITFDIEVATTMNTADITMTTDTGGKVSATGVPGDGGAKNPSVSDMNEKTVGGKTIKIKDGKLKKKNKNGTWSTVKKNKKVVKKDLSEDSVGTGPMQG